MRLNTEHHFRVADAKKYGITKAVLLYNLRFWLDFCKAGERNIHMLDQYPYYWIYNSCKAFSKIFPYIGERSIARHLIDLEAKGVIMSNEFNKNKYDRTKWYTMPEYQKKVTPFAKMTNGETRNVGPIPDTINTDNTYSGAPHEKVFDLSTALQRLKNDSPKNQALYIFAIFIEYRRDNLDGEICSQDMLNKELRKNIRAAKFLDEMNWENDYYEALFEYTSERLAEMNGDKGGKAWVPHLETALKFHGDFNLKYEYKKINEFRNKPQTT